MRMGKQLQSSSSTAPNRRRNVRSPPRTLLNLRKRQSLNSLNLQASTKKPSTAGMRDLKPELPRSFSPTRKATATRFANSAPSHKKHSIGLKLPRRNEKRQAIQLRG